MKTLDLRDSEMRCGELERDVESSYMKVPYVLMIMYDCASHKCMTGFFCGVSVFFRVFGRDSNNRNFDSSVENTNLPHFFLFSFDRHNNFVFSSFSFLFC